VTPSAFAVFMLITNSNFVGRRELAHHRRDLPPAVDPTQPDLPTRHEAE
jgi:hypothetical protein